MKHQTEIKSSFTLPPQEVMLVGKLKRRLKLKTNTAVIRKALAELNQKIDRETLREQFRLSSLAVREANKQDMQELDELASEGIP